MGYHDFGVITDEDTAPLTARQIQLETAGDA